jgi:3',5'-cyclic AMP phosphodiesterase CpdA
MADSQWQAPDDGRNPNTSAIGLISQLNAAFIAQKVKFVVQVGDLADNGGAHESGTRYTTSAALGEDTRALFAQALFDHGIGFFPCRGNHDNAVAAAFAADFPQTRNGLMNASPDRVFDAVPACDAATQPAPARWGAPFTVGSNFDAIGQPAANLAGLSYGFDYQNARFVLIDQFKPADDLDPDGVSPYALETTVARQQAWIGRTLAQRPAASQHAFLFSHKGIITQQHVDVLFGDCPSDRDVTVGTTTYKVAPGAASAFIRTAEANGVRLYFCGHDHIHARSIVKTTDGLTPHARLTHVLCQSVSSKFYTPNECNDAGNGQVPPCTANDQLFCGGRRQTMLSQELYRVGYYIVTVDGPNVSVDYHSAPAFPAYAGSATEAVITTTPELAFTWRETFGYSLVGRQFVVDHGGSFTAVADTGPKAGTVARILAGTNGNPNSDPSGRRYGNAVNTGWYPQRHATASDILVLWGMAATLGSGQTDEYVLSLTCDPPKGKSFILATPDGRGRWVNAVSRNLGGTPAPVTGPWKPGYALGTYGLDREAGTVWAVLDHDGYFAAVAV